jgi:erythronate-4-phosphate dehydrogenase
MICSALAEFLKVPNRKEEWLSLAPDVKDNIIIFDESLNLADSINYIFKKVYNIRRDDAELRKILNQPSGQRGSYFDLLRKQYPLRREMSSYTVRLKTRNPELEKILKAFRMKIEYF